MSRGSRDVIIFRLILCSERLLFSQEHEEFFWFDGASSSYGGVRHKNPIKQPIIYGIYDKDGLVSLLYCAICIKVFNNTGRKLYFFSQF